MASAPPDLFGAPSMADSLAALPPTLPAVAPSAGIMSTAPNLEDPPESAIDKLKPGSDRHGEVLQKLQAMVKFSASKMSNNYSRWRNAEMKVQAYMMQGDYDMLVNTVQESKGAIIPEPINVVVPYTYATLHAAATYISSVLLGRKPIFPLMATRGTNAETARYMELALQSNLDHNMGMEKLWQHVWDSLLYGFSPIKTGWEQTRGKTMRMENGQRSFTEDIKYAGNSVNTVDPYKLLPDPRVPLHECHRKGDFCFDRVELSAMVLKDMETQGLYKYTDEAIKLAKQTGRTMSDSSGDFTSNRGPMGGKPMLNPKDVVAFIPGYEGTVRLVPKDWKLGDGTAPELWRFVFTDKQIVMAQVDGAIHDQLPYLIAEPTSMGHDFMSLSQAEMIGVFQDVLSWLVSSRMENVRASIANSYVFDPARVEVNDMRSSAIGRLIRLKQSAMGLPVKEAIMQLQVNDVTGGHFTDIQTIRLIADTTTGVNDNLRGINTQGGRRSATEARMSMQAGAGRLSQLAMRMSGQSFNPLAQQMISNIQQYLPLDFWIESTGDENGESLKLGLAQLVGSFNYQVSDGTLPLDRGALVEQWKEILMGVAQDPELRQRFDIGKIFDYVALMSGAKNIDSFKRQPTIAGPGQAMPAGAVPVDQGVPQMPASLAFAQGQQ